MSVVRLYTWLGEEPNFGDRISSEIVRWVSGFGVEEVAPSKERKLLAVGSVLDKVQNGDVVWGSGLLARDYNVKVQDRLVETAFEVLLVRGPLTRTFLEAIDVDCPEFCCDPAVLLPKIYPKARNPERPFGIVRHLRDLGQCDPNEFEIDVRWDWHKVVDAIVSCERIISSSLHGIVIAEAYGVPAIFLQPYRRVLVKYLDYYLSTGRIVMPVQTVEAAKNTEPPELPEFDHAAVIESFDKDRVPIYDE